MGMSITELTMEQVREHNPELYEQIRKSVDPEKVISELSDKLAKAEEATQELTTERDDLQGKLEEITTERDELKSKVDAFESAEKLAEKKDMVTRMISEAKMPKELISDHFMEELIHKDGEEEIKAAIEDRMKPYDKLKGKVTDSGEEHISESTEESEITEDEVLEAVTR